MMMVVEMAVVKMMDESGSSNAGGDGDGDGDGGH